MLIKPMCGNPQFRSLIHLLISNLNLDLLFFRSNNTSMDRAIASGRWVNLPEPQGRFPSDASQAADISIGLGISTAVDEAVSLGGRGVHYDHSAMRGHPYYSWGEGKVVFDDIESMMAALKRYRADPMSEPELGEFSSRIEQVDPFRDGRGNERIGNYLGWLMKGLGAGLDRDLAVREANQQYTHSWGDAMVSTIEPGTWIV